VAPTNRNSNQDDEEMHLEFNSNDVDYSDSEGNGVVEEVSFGPADEFDVL